MNIRYVVRYNHSKTTPAALAELIGAKVRRCPSTAVLDGFSYHRDFLFKYPPQALLQETDAETRRKVLDLQEFCNLSKFHQRMRLKAWGLPIPWTCGDKISARGAPGHRFVVRPMIHSRGEGYRLTDDATDFVEGDEYVSAIFPKTREYRILCVYGEPVLVINKRPMPDATAESAWTGTEARARWETVHDFRHSYLGRTDILERLRTCEHVRNAHIVGVDVLYRPGEYVICEFNGSPALRPMDLERIADVIERR